MVRTRVVVALIAILLIGGGAFLIFSPYLTGDDYLKDFFLQQLEQSIGRKIDVHRIKLVLFPRIRLELTQVAIHDRNSDDILLSAKKLDLVLRFFPLLRKQVVGKRLLIEEPTFTLRRNRSGHWNLLDQVVQGLVFAPFLRYQYVSSINRNREKAIAHFVPIFIHLEEIPLPHLYEQVYPLYD